jgi:hypothetical protein
MDPSSEGSSTVDDFPAIQMKYLAGHVRRVVGCQEHIRWTQFLRLAGALHGRVGSMLGSTLLIEGGWNQWSPDGAWRYRIDANSFVDQVLRQGSCKGDNRSFCGRVIEQLRAAFVWRLST